MSITVNWKNPYAQREGRWLRGNLHTHTSPASGCSTVPPDRMLDLYAQAGYDFLAISDHLVLTQMQDSRMTLIPGIEWHCSQGEHAGVYGFDLEMISRMCTEESQEKMLAAMAPTGALLILNHPNWKLVPHYRREQLEAAQHYQGIEIFNGVIKRLHGYELATDKWDYLLYKDKRVLGFASDDAHAETDVALGWIMVRSNGTTAEDILAAVLSGNFYSSSGVTISDIRRTGDVVELETDDAQEIQVICDGGRLLKSVRDTSMAFDMAESPTKYVRFAAYGQGSEMAWTQPFFLE